MSFANVYKISVVPRISVQSGITLDEQGPVMLTATPSKFLMNPGNSHVVTLNGVIDGTTLNFWNASASISGTLVDCNGFPVAECNQALAVYTPNSNGVFTIQFGDFNFQPAPGTEYTFWIDGSMNGVTLHIELLVEVVARST